MSFDWNLSDDDDEDLDTWTKRNNIFNDFQEEEDQLAVPAAAKPPPPSFAHAEDDDDDSEEEDGVDWEDAEDTEEVDITIDLNREEKKKSSKKRKRKKKFRVESLPADIQTFLWNLNRSTLLSLTSRAVFLSSLCSDHTLMATSYSILPDWTINSTLRDAKRFIDWFYNLTHNVERRRAARQRSNRRAGAPRSKSKQSPPGYNTQMDRLLAYVEYLSPRYEDDPQLAPNFTPSETDTVLLFVAMARSMGFRTRLVQSMEPISPDLDENHPILMESTNLFSAIAKKKKRKSDVAKLPSKEEETRQHHQPLQSSCEILLWAEILCKDARKRRWVHVDPLRSNFDSPDVVETFLSKQSESRRKCIAYALAVEHCDHQGKNIFHVTDVTPRYAASFVATLRLRGIRGKKTERNQWWTDTLRALNEQGSLVHQPLGNTEDEAIVLDDSDDDRKMPAVENPLHMDDEVKELSQLAGDEAMPTSKQAFRTHPIYVLPSLLGKAEVLAPDASKRVCGVFKGELVYKRTDVSTALSQRKWPYKGRRVLAAELTKPIKRVKARKKPASKNFKPLQTYGVGSSNDGSEGQRAKVLADASEPLDDGMENLYAMWQTEPWSPPYVGPNDPIPTNEFKNVELELLNPGLVHIDERGVAGVAKKLGVPYAPCLLGFEGHGGNRTPTIRGIVVHQHNEQLIREAAYESTSFAIETEHEKRKQIVYKRWKKLLVGLLTKDRIEKAYGDDDESKA